MNNQNHLLNNLHKLHTTTLGITRIKRNLSLETDNTVAWCAKQIQSSTAVIARKGKNWYITINDYLITVNASSYTIITAHKLTQN